jgi:hypothetical protein
MESSRDDQQRTYGRSHHHTNLLRSQTPVPTPKYYDYSFQAVHGHREAHYAPQVRFCTSRRTGISVSSVFNLLNLFPIVAPCVIFVS